MIEEIVQLLIPEEGNFSLQGATATCHRLYISGEQKTEVEFVHPVSAGGSVKFLPAV